MISLKKPPTKVNLGKVFWKAVKGTKNLKEKAEKEKVPQPVSLEVIQNILPYLSEVKAQVETKIPVEAKIAGVSITEPIGPVRIKEPEVDLSEINLVYTLIPSGSDIPFAAANIKWSKKDSSLIYYVIEPELTVEEKDLLEKIKTTLIEKLDVDFSMLRKEEARSYLKKKFEETVNLMAANLPEVKRQQILYYIERDFIGLGKIEPLMKDPNIEDISCDGVGIPIFIYHRNPLIGSIKTNIVFNDKEELDIFVNKLAQRCGKNISIAQPLIGGSLPDGSRVQATLGTDIARKGSNFTIRRFTEEPLTPVHLLKFKTLDAKIAAFLWLAVEYGRSILISGGVATGKTTLLNALSLFIKPELKIVSIEDTAELLLPHPHWVPAVARMPIAEIEGKKLGEVDLFDLLRESLRQRPDYIIVGEVRGREAYVLFQQIATGHSSMATIHADSIERLVDRLTTPPINLPANLIEALDLIIFIVRIKYGSTYVRRVNAIYEILGFDREKNFPIINEIFRWKASNDTFEAVNPSVVLKKISQQYGISEQILQKEISNRIKILNWMYENNIENYLDVSKVIKLYYTNQEDLLSNV
ncbi:MAG: type II/IV secretion system ATPase subunit [Candidatus Aenigmatarchaeota archaeon]